MTFLKHECAERYCPLQNVSSQIGFLFVLFMSKTQILKPLDEIIVFLDRLFSVLRGAWATAPPVNNL